MRWQARTTRRAEGELAALPDQVRRRIARRIDLLQVDARPPGSLKLVGAERLWRLRVGSYRVIYRIEDAVLTVLVVRIAHRRDIYR